MSIKHVIAVASICTLAAGGVVASEQAAAAAPLKAHCATEHDYKQVKKHQLLGKVQHELHSKGHVQASSHDGGYRDEVRSFKACSQYAAISVGFSAKPHQPLREDAKDGVFPGA